MGRRTYNSIQLNLIRTAFFSINLLPIIIQIPISLLLIFGHMPERTRHADTVRYHTYGESHGQRLLVG